MFLNKNLKNQLFYKNLSISNKKKRKKLFTKKADKPSGWNWALHEAELESWNLFGRSQNKIPERINHYLLQKKMRQRKGVMQSHILVKGYFFIDPAFSPPGISSHVHKSIQLAEYISGILFTINKNEKQQ